MDQPDGAAGVAAALAVEVVLEEVVVEEVVVDDVVVDEVAVEVALDVVVEEAIEVVVTELSAMAANADSLHDPPHLLYMSPAQATLQSVFATSLAAAR